MHTHRANDNGKKNLTIERRYRDAFSPPILPQGGDYIKRLPNRYGTVYRLTGERSRPWIARKAGVTVGYYATKEDALQALAQAQNMPVFTRSRITFEEIYSQWSEAKFGTISKSMANDYKGAFKYCGLVHKRRFADLHVFDYEEMVRNTEIPRTYIHRIRVLLSQMYAYALRHDLCDRDVSALLDIKEDNETRAERHLFTHDEVEALFLHSGDTYVDMILVSLYTGMRPAELVELRKKDVNLEERTMTAGKKTKAGKNRTIPIHTRIYPVLKERVGKGPFSPSETVFVSEAGKAMTYKTYRLWFAQICQGHTPYDTRHTFASRWHVCGLDPLIEKLVMGHAVSDVTKGVYTHLSDRRLVEEVDRLFF